MPSAQDGHLSVYSSSDNKFVPKPLSAVAAGQYVSTAGDSVAGDLDVSGRMGIGGAVDSGYRLKIYGDVFVDGTVTATNVTGGSGGDAASYKGNSDPSAAEFARLVGVTSGIQGQLDDRLNMTATRAANAVLAGPTSGGAAAPTFRALVAADVPSLDAAKIATGTLPEARGGTNQSTYATGDMLYASAANTLSKLAGNTAATKKFLAQTGTGSASAAPSWETLTAADFGGGAALTKADDANVTLTLGGSPSAALLAAVSLTLGWTGTLAAGRLNGNVVQAVTNDTNVTGSVASQTLTLGWSGTLSPARGGTGANLSATGGAGHVLRQSSGGAAVTVSQLAASDLSNGTTGSGAVVLATSPSLVTPSLGAATATSVNKVAITAPAAAATLTIADGKTLTASNSLSLSGTDGKQLALAGSLTVGADTSVAGGGTLALGGFTLTVPATGTAVLTSRTVTEGAGLAGNTYDLSADRTLALGTPSTLTTSTANSASGTTHTHAVTTSSVGAASTILAADASGKLQLAALGLGTAPGAYTLYAGSGRFDGDLLLGAGTANLYMKDTATGWQVSSTTVIVPQSGNSVRSAAYASGLVGWNVTAAGDAEFHNATVRGAIRAAVFTYNHVSATAGTLGVFKSAARLRAEVSIPAVVVFGTTPVTLDVDDQEGVTHAASQLFAVNDILRIKDALVGDTWFRVSAVSDQTSFWRYTAVIMAGSIVSVVYSKGLGVANYGQSGQGFIVQTADQPNSPYLQMATHAAAFTSQDSSGTLVVTPQLRIGNLNGSYGYGSDAYGMGAGRYASGGDSAWVTVDQTNGFRVGRDTVTLAQWDISGNILVGRVGAGQSNVLITAGAVQLRNNATVRAQIASDGSAYFGNNNLSISSGGVLSVGGWTVNSSTITGASTTLDSAGKLALGTSTDVVILDAADSTYRLAVGHTTYASAPFRVTKAGALTATGATISGAVTATSGAIGGWALGATSLTSGSGATTVGLDSGGTNPAIYAGSATPASAPFRVTNAGALTAASGAVGGWAISSSSISSGGITLAANASAASNKIYVGTGSYGTSATGFYVDGSGRFSLKDKLTWDGSTFTMGVVGGALSLTYQNATNGSISSHTFTKTGGGAAWDAGFSSVQSLDGDGFITWTAPSGAQEFMVGLSTSDPDSNFTSILYAIYYSSSSGASFLFNSGTLVGAPGGYASGSGTVLKVERVGTSIKLYVGGTLRHTITGDAGLPLHLDTSVNNVGGTVPPVTMEKPGSTGYFTFDGTTLSVMGTVNALGGTIGGTLQLTGAAGALAVGAAAPTSSSDGTGIWIDRTGLYGLAAGAVQAKLDATTGAITAGAGAVQLTSAGLGFSAGAGGSVIHWRNGSGISVGSLDASGSVSGLVHLAARGNTAATNPATVQVRAVNSTGVTEALFHLYANGNASSYAYLGNNGPSQNPFAGLRIASGEVTAPDAPAQLLDVRGVACITGSLVVGGTAPTLSGSGKLHVAGDALRIDTARTPSSASATGNAGEVCWDSNYVYVCVAPNTWKRAPLSTW